jgi:class 3 adenylate cyclase
LENKSKTCLRYATSEPYLGCDELFRFTNTMLQGLAVLRSRERSSKPAAVAVIDQAASGTASVTAEFLTSWSAAGYGAASHPIDLAPLRQAHPVPQAPNEPAMAPIPVEELTRPVKAMLFADVAGFSKIKEWQQFKYRTSYANYLRDLFASPFGKTAIYANTWGDALHVVFDKVADAASFACELLEPTVAHPPDWQAFGLGKITPFRVGLHTGPVFELTDLFQGRSEFAGQNVTRAARIEPATVPGCAYASEPFAALLMMQAGKDFLIEGVGEHSLAKDYDRCPLYRIQRALQFVA